MLDKSNNFHSSLSVHPGWKTLLLDAVSELNSDNELTAIRSDKDGRLHLHDLRHQLYQLTTNSGDPLFPIRCAQFVSPITFGSYSLVLMTAPTLDTALAHAEEFSIVISTPIRLKYQKDKQGNGELWILSNEPYNQETHVTYLGIIFYIAVTLRMLLAIVNDKSLIVKVKLVENHFTQDLIQQIESLTHAKVTSGEPIRKILIEKKYLHRGNTKHDSSVYYAALALLRKETEMLKQNDLILKVINTLNDFDQLAHASAESVARSLNLNVRTLSRKLAELNTSYRSVVEKYKLEKALYLLENSHQSMTEIAYHLGFSDLSSFSRAFKRWTGQCPATVKRHVNPPCPN